MTRPHQNKKPAKSPCPLCSKPLAPQGIRLHFQRVHPGEPVPSALPAASSTSSPSSAEERARFLSGKNPPARPAPRSSGLLEGEGGIFS